MFEKLQFDCSCGMVLPYTELDTHDLWKHLARSNR
jgi:hypothetical protein